MITKHKTPEGDEIEIQWEFREKEEDFDSNWWSWFVLGEGSDGKQYGGMCQADGSEPEDLNQGWVDGIEEIDPVPMEAPPMYIV